MLVFHGVRRAVGEKLDDIGFADQAEPVAPQRNGPRSAHTGPRFDARIIDAGVHRLPAQGVHVLGKSLFGVDQQTLARAIAPVLQGGEGKRVRIGYRQEKNTVKGR
jgi:hypothetical protein